MFQKQNFALFLTQFIILLGNGLLELTLCALHSEVLLLQLQGVVGRLEFLHLFRQQNLVFPHFGLSFPQELILGSERVEFLVLEADFRLPVHGGLIEFFEVRHEIRDFFIFNFLEGILDFALELFLVKPKVVFYFPLIDERVYSESEFFVVELRVLNVGRVDVAAL